MLYRIMPKNGDRLSILGFGCMRLPETRGRINTKDATRQVHRAIDSGVNYFDTAYPYHMGAAEPFLGRALSGKREKVKIATKLPPASVKKTEDMDAILNKQLARLQTDRVDYYLLHGLERKSWSKLIRLNVLTFLENAIKQGKIVNTGFSFHGSITLFKEVVDAFDWDFCQIQYNFLDEFHQAGTEGLEYAAAKGLGVVIMEPLRGGTLVRNVPKPVEKLYKNANLGKTPADLALRWVWNRPEVTVVLSGMTEDAHIEENLRIAADALPGGLTQAEAALIAEITETYRALLKAGCTGCRYCMPCPAGVDIPMCLDLYNRVASFGEQKFHNLVRYGLHLGAMEPKGNRGFASQCEKCGKCESKCPQHLPIQRLLEDVTAEFENFSFKMLMLYGRFFFSRAR